MDSLKFKTSIKCAACVQKVTAALNQTVGENNWHVDIQDPMKVLTVSVPIEAEAVEQSLKQVGYSASCLQ